MLLVFWRCGDFAAWSGILVVLLRVGQRSRGKYGFVRSGSGRTGRVHLSRCGPVEPGALL